MGNVVCCANDADGVVDASELLNDKKPKLFGTKIGLNASAEDSNEEAHPLEGK